MPVKFRKVSALNQRGNMMLLLVALLAVSTLFAAAVYRNRISNQAPTMLGTETINAAKCMSTGAGSYTTNGREQPMTVTTPIRQYLGYIPVGGIATVNIMAVGSGTITVTDTSNNTYQLVRKQVAANNPSAASYMFVTNVTTGMPVGTTITIDNTNARSMSFSVTGCTKPSSPLSLVEVQSQNGYTNLPISPTVNVLPGDAVLSMAGINRRSTSFGLGYPSGMIDLECQNAGMQSGSETVAATIDTCVATATTSNPVTMQLNIVNSKKRSEPAPDVDWSYIIAVYR